MKKRLRKKKHLEEFVEWGVPITIARRDQGDFDRFLDAFLEQAIEGTNCYFGGGGKKDQLEGVIELGKTSDRPAERLRKVLDWLASQDDVEKYVTGNIIDLWHGPFDEIDTIGERLSPEVGAATRNSGDFSSS